MPAYEGPAVSTPALDFLATVRGKEQTPGGTSAFSILEKDDRATLNDLLRRSGAASNTEVPRLEREARTFLFTYRELAKSTGVLDTEERRRLDQILERQQPQQERKVVVLRRAFNWPNVRLRWVIAVMVAIAAVVTIFGVRAYVISTQSGPPPGNTQQHPPAQQVPPGTTSLQQLKRNFGAWQQITPSDQRPQTSNPAMLLLENGGYFASEKWTVSPDAQGWQQNIAGNIDNVDVKGDHADITDADGNPYLVGVNQPFIVSSNPGTVLRIDSTGDVLSMTLATATAERQPLHS